VYRSIYASLKRKNRGTPKADIEAKAREIAAFVQRSYETEMRAKV